MIEYRNQPDRAQLAWRLRRAKRVRQIRQQEGTSNPDTEQDCKPTAIEITQIHTSPDDPKERNENEPDE